jgi:hypothetical protein
MRRAERPATPSRCTASAEGRESGDDRASNAGPGRHAGELEELRGALRRYGLEYVVACESSMAAASDRLTRLAADGRPVAIVCAPAAMIETGGGEFLAMAHRLYPAAKPLFV